MIGFENNEHGVYTVGLGSMTLTEPNQPEK